ncbi:hypothetical protein PIB30_071245, partial [Stylosanthes scabra]|nr:hypothetical protein [Stylosanthes scabra]
DAMAVVGGRVAAPPLPFMEEAPPSSPPLAVVPELEFAAVTEKGSRVSATSQFYVWGFHRKENMLMKW